MAVGASDALEQAARGAVAVLLGHRRPSGCGGRRAPARSPASARRMPRSRWMAKVCVSSPLISADPPVAELHEQPRRLVEGAFIVDVDEGIVEIEAFAAAMHDEGNAELRGAAPRAGRPAAARRCRRRRPACWRRCGGRWSPRRRRRPGDSTRSSSCAARIVAEAGQELDEMRVDVDGGAGRHDIADHAGLAGRQPPRARVGPVAMALGGVHHAPARFLADLRIAVQRAAHRRLRKRQHLRQLLEVHRRSKSSKRFEYRRVRRAPRRRPASERRIGLAAVL